MANPREKAGTATLERAKVYRVANREIRHGELDPFSHLASGLTLEADLRASMTEDYVGPETTPVEPSAAASDSSPWLGHVTLLYKW